MSRNVWKNNGVSVRKCADFGELTVTLVDNYKHIKYQAYGEFAVTIESTGEEIILAAVAVTPDTCTLYDMEKRTLYVKRALTIKASDLNPRSLGYLLLNFQRLSNTVQL